MAGWGRLDCRKLNEEWTCRGSILVALVLSISSKDMSSLPSHSRAEDILSFRRGVCRGTIVFVSVEAVVG